MPWHTPVPVHLPLYTHRVRSTSLAVQKCHLGSTKWRPVHAATVDFYEVRLLHHGYGSGIMVQEVFYQGEALKPCQKPCQNTLKIALKPYPDTVIRSLRDPVI